ncbi:terminase large subunit [Paraburkholderia sp. D15]|uniref:phage terminase large subunit n=1 Tax=Paraburkholderia sp. D15 TaxID=2880218 RepID=UPI00247B094E|nr:phage terminase large subunit [Paraburkholderia sp. D15]WGS53566.1 terminase large subunit [Paraburkholderia sp. D15]
MTRELDVDLTLTEPQERFVFSEAQFPAFVGGFGAGKSDALVTRLMIKKLLYPQFNVGYFAPTYDLISLIAWPKFEERLDAMKIRHKLNKADKELKVGTGGSCIFRTLDDPNRIVGFEISDGGIDEFDTLEQKKAANAWRKCLARCRKKKPDGEKNTLAIATTPEGFRFVYETWEKAPKTGYTLYRAPTSSNPFLPDGYIDQLREIYPANLLDAYLEGLFVNLTSGAVYPEFSRHLNHVETFAMPGEPLHIGIDFNVYNCTAIICVTRFDQPIVVGELTGVRDTPTLAQMLTERFAGHHISVYPDASGQGHKSINASLSDLQILRDHGFTVCAHPTNPAVRDRVNSVNGLVLSGTGHRALQVNTQLAPVLTECLEQQVYDKNGEPDKTAGKDHCPDALGYFITYRWPVVRNAFAFASISK